MPDLDGSIGNPADPVHKRTGVAAATPDTLQAQQEILLRPDQHQPRSG
jgi:hypothetical protein